jgi:acetoin utilization protein AcuB
MVSWSIARRAEEKAMFVKERMTKQPVVAAPDMSVPDALNQMRQQRIRRLPVVDKGGRLVGIVSDRDLLHASPSPATSLSVWEITYLLSKVLLKDVMTSKVITVNGDTPLEDAARIMADNKIGGLPVVDDGALVGIITETDLFKVFVELLGARDRGVRVTLSVPNTPGQLAGVTRSIADRGGNIIAIAELAAADRANRQVMVKASGISRDEMVAALTPAVIAIQDVRES